MRRSYAALAGLRGPRQISTQGCALGYHIMPFQGNLAANAIIESASTCIMLLWGPGCSELAVAR
jgi:hypothetical protein